MVEASQILGFFTNGIVFGSILALSAVGLTLVYGILNLSNFAHGDFVTMGAFGALLMAVTFGAQLTLLGLVLPILLLLALAGDHAWTRFLTRGEQTVLAGFALALLAVSAWLWLDRPEPTTTTDLMLVAATLVSIVLSVGVLLGLEFLVWRPLRRKRGTALTLIIVSIGIGLIIRNGLQLRFGGGLHSFPRPTPVSDLILGVPVSDAQQFTLVASVVLIAGIHFFLQNTKVGKAMRALADNLDLARVSGIDVDRIIVYVWAIAGALTAIAGVLLSLVNNNTMNVNMGFALLLPLFSSVILGGIGSPYGAIAGGLLVGLATKMSVLWLGSQYELAAAFLILVLVLVVRPQGLLGGRT